MGAQIQTKRHSTGYCSIWGLDKNTENDIWSAYHEDKPQKNGQYCESLLPLHLKLDGLVEYSKEKMRQTILKHESTFRHQLQELHRLYGKQRELMNVYSRIDVKPLRIEEEASSWSPFSSHISEEAKRGWRGSHVPSVQLVFGQSSVAEFSTKQSFPGFCKEKNMMAFPSRDDRTSKIWKPASSKGILSRSGIIDLEIPADASMNNEAKDSSTCSKENLRGTGVKTLFGFALNDHHSGNASRSSLPLKMKNELADLNEPTLLEEMSLLGSAGNPVDLNSSWENIQSEDKSATPNSVINCTWNDTPLSSKKDMSGGTCFKSLRCMTDMSRKEELSCDFNAMKMRQDSLSFSRDVYSRESSVAFQSSKDEHKKLLTTSEPGSTGRQTKRKLFGVDILEMNDESSVTKTAVVHCADKCDELGSKQSILHVKSSVDSSTRSVPSSINGVSYQNGLSFCSQLNAKHSQGNSIGNCKLIYAATTVELPKECTPVDLEEAVEHLDCLQWKSGEASKIPTKAPNVFQADFSAEYNILPADCQSKQKSLKELQLYLMENAHSVEQGRTNNNYHLNLDSLQQCNQQFFKNSTSLSSERLTHKLEKISPVLIHDTDDSDTELHLPSSITMNKDFRPSDKQKISSDLNFAGRSSEPTCLADDGGSNAGDLSLENVVCGHHPGGNCVNLEVSRNDPVSCFTGHIDLNLSLVEDEAPSSPCLPTAIVKLAKTGEELEVPIVTEPEAHKQIDVSSDELKEPCEELVRLAAEIIVAISVSGGEDIVNDATAESVQDTPNECLEWFVDVVSSYECNTQNNRSDANLKGNNGCIEELIPDGMDYFEYMTLKLEDMKDDNVCYNYSAPVMDNQEDEETKVNTLSRRPRRGQARRGRQRKDFQRVVLPSLISLSKLEMTEDFQTFEELLRASGYPWQSSFSRRSTAKSSRGRRRSVAIPPTQVAEAVCSPLEPKPASAEVQPEDKTVTGWGKRTRRLPRQRFMAGNTTRI